MPNSDSQIEVLLTANFAELQAGMGGAAAVVQSGTDAMGASFQAFTADASVLDEIVKKNIKSFAELADAEAALDRLQQSGLVSTEELTAAFESLNTQEALLTKNAAQSTVALTEQTGATVALGGATAGVTRELAVMTGEALRGNYSRLIGSTTVLANRTGLLVKAIDFLKSPLGLATAGMALPSSTCDVVCTESA